MRVDIYRSSKHPTQFLSVPSGSKPANVSLPAGIDFGVWQPFKQNKEIIAGEHRVALDAADVIRQIQAKGFALHGVEVRVEETPRPKSD